MMNYTDKELNENMGVVFRESVTESEMGCTLDWKKWRVVEYTSTKCGSEDTIEYKVREIVDIRKEICLVDMLKLVFTWGHCDTVKRYDLQWGRSYHYDGYAPTFKTKEEAFKYMNKQIELSKETHTTSKILSIKPD